MRLTTRNIHHYLLDKGFLNMASLVEGDYSVVQGQTRNQVFRIIRRKSKSLFVKQLNSFDPGNTYILQKDATCLWLIKNNPAFENLSVHVPEYFGFDPERQVLVTEYLPNAVSLEEYIRSSGSVSVSVLEELASILATYHSPASDDLLSTTSVQFFPRQIPWVMQAGGTPPAFIGQQPATLPLNNPAMGSVTGNPVFSNALAEVKNGWQPTSLIHGDIKWMNLLLFIEDGKEKLNLIDWEIADIGDPLWDVAGVFQSLVTDAVLYNVPQMDTTANAAPGLTLNDLSPAWPAIRSFWEMYRAKISLNDGSSEKEAALEKTIRYTGARLVQTAVEHNMMVTTLQPGAAKLLQASLLLLTNVPQVAAQLQPIP